MRGRGPELGPAGLGWDWLEAANSPPPRLASVGAAVLKGHVSPIHSGLSKQFVLVSKARAWLALCTRSGFACDQPGNMQC